jgi:hypothetical protein
MITKAELSAALAELLDDMDIVIEPISNLFDNASKDGDLFNILDGDDPFLSYRSCSLTPMGVSRS